MTLAEQARRRDLFPPERQEALERAGTLLIHGCGLAREGKGYLFLAPSGGGKSTLARLSTGSADCLSDEHLLLLTGGHPRIAAPPCCPAVAFPEGIEIEKAFVLGKEGSLSFAPLTPGELLAALAPQIYASSWEPDAARGILGAARRACERIPAWRMAFALDSRPWDRIPALRQ